MITLLVNLLKLINRGLQKSIKNKKDVVFNKDYWRINFSHDGYLKKYSSIHERLIEFYPQEVKFIGTDKIIKNNNNNYNLILDFI